MVYRSVICVLFVAVVGVGLGCGLFTDGAEDADTTSEHSSVTEVPAPQETVTDTAACG